MGNWVQTLKQYWSFTFQHKLQTVIVLILQPLAILADWIVFPYFVVKLIVELIEISAGSGGSQAQAMQYFWLAFSVFLFEVILRRIIGFIYIDLQVKNMKSAIAACHKKFLELTYGFHSDSFAGALLTKANRYGNEIENIQDNTVHEFFPLFIRIVAIGIIFVFKSTLLGAVFFGWLIFYLVVVLVMLKMKTPLSRDSATGSSNVTAVFADSLSNVTTVKSFAAEDFEESRFEIVNEAHTKLRRRSWFADEFIRATKSVLLLGFFASIFLLAINYVVSGQLSGEEMLLLQTYMLTLLGGLWELSNQMQRFETSLANASEMTEVFGIEPDLKNNSQDKLVVCLGDISFRDIGFEYQDSSSTKVFDNLSLEIPGNQKIGLVGTSGGGKSTISKLLLRFADLSKGQILIDGQDISQITQQSLRDAIAYVEQEPVLFHRSLAENISYGQDAEFESIVTAAKSANAHDFILDLPHGYDTLVGERGMKLSGGQKQRIAIARAFLKDAPILILDEATSALDSVSEGQVQQALWTLMAERTTLVIAHRLSTIMKLDRIIVLENGLIVEDGTHTELLASGNAYAELWNHQSSQH